MIRETVDENSTARLYFASISITPFFGEHLWNGENKKPHTKM